VSGSVTPGVGARATSALACGYSPAQETLFAIADECSLARRAECRAHARHAGASWSPPLAIFPRDVANVASWLGRHAEAARLTRTRPLG